MLEDIRKEMPDPKLFDAWYLTDEGTDEELEWPEEMSGWSSRQKELWGVQQAMRAIWTVMEGATIIHRGDSPVWRGDLSDCSYKIVGDLDVSYEGKSPIFEVKAYLPSVKAHFEQKLLPPCQGLDKPNISLYLNEQKRTGRPFYVLWVWANETKKSVSVRGERIDLLPRPGYPIWKQRKILQEYWIIEHLRSIGEIAEDIAVWDGSPFQLALV